MFGAFSALLATILMLFAVLALFLDFSIARIEVF